MSTTSSVNNGAGGELSLTRTDVSGAYILYAVYAVRSTHQSITHVDLSRHVLRSRVQGLPPVVSRES